jgi:O-methyltransferase
MSLKSALKQTIRLSGFEVKRVEPLPQSGQKYEKIYPIASYSPWNVDTEFQRLYRVLRHYTLVDVYRCYELWQLVAQSAKLPTGALIEVGVWKGGTGAIIAAQAQRSQIDEKVYLCDTFTGVVKAGEKDNEYHGGEHADATYNDVWALLRRLHLDHTELLQGIFPDETASRIADQTFRFCHIDVDVYESAKDILQWIWPKMVSGGIIVYDDYGFSNCSGITQHVEEQFAAPDRLILHNLNGHAVLLKR